MTKEIAETTGTLTSNRGTVPAALRAAAAGIRLQRNYLRGRHHESCRTPESILLFTRTDGQDLNDHPHRHFHHRHLLLLPLSGNGRLIVDERAHGLQPGRALLIRPYQFHHYSGIDTGPILWLFITFEVAEPWPDHPSLCAVNDPHTWTDVVRLVETYLQPQSPATDRALALRLALLLEDLGQRARPAPAVSDIKGTRDAEQLILKVRRIVLDDLSRPLSIADLARQLGLSASRLRARFRQSTGYSIGRFQRTIRMQHAAQLLSREGYSVSEAATACGWDSSFSFSRAFKHYWGSAPKTFR